MVNPLPDIQVDAPDGPRLAAPRHTDVSGVVLAGGRGRRLGGIDKGLLPFGGKPLVCWVLEVLRPQVVTVLINANRSLDAYAELGCELVNDDLDGFQGPLAGMASALGQVRTEYAAFVPCDSPFLPADLVAKLYHGRERAAKPIAVAHSGGRLQPVFCLIATALRDDMEKFLQRGERKIDRFFAEAGFIGVDFSAAPDRFMNINRQADLDAAGERLLGGTVK